MTSNTSQTKTKKSPNFLPEEDEQLAKSWSKISQDPITANQQGRDNFFSCIANDYNQFTPGPQRDANGLQNRSVFLSSGPCFRLNLIMLSLVICRWKTLQKQTLLFTSIYNQIAKYSSLGSAPSDWLVKA
jgi:hypothetical protein